MNLNVMVNFITEASGWQLGYPERLRVAFVVGGHQLHTVENTSNKAIDLKKSYH